MPRSSWQWPATPAASWTAAGPAGDRWMQESAVLPLNGGESGGALLIGITYEEVPTEMAWTFTITVELTAVAADGATKWTRSSTGVVSFSDAGIVLSNLSYPLAVGPVNGDGDDVVMRTDDTAYSGAAGGTSRLEVLDGDTGRPGAVVQAASQDDAPASNLVSDLDGDGLLDIVTAWSSGGQVMVLASKGTDGRPLWRNSFAGLPVYWIEGAGQTDADEVEDLLLMGVDWEGERFLSFAVASGADGTPGLTGSSDGLVKAGDIDRDARDDVLLLKSIFSWTRMGMQSRRSAQRARGCIAPRMPFRSRRGRPSGSWAWVMSVTSTGTAPLTSCTTSPCSGSTTVTVQERRVVLTRTGRKVHEKLPGQPLYASLEGRGDDTVWLARTDNGVRVSARDGLSAERLWQRTVGVPSYRGGFALGADLTRDGRAEMILIARRAGTGAVVKVINGRTQRIRWSR